MLVWDEEDNRMSRLQVLVASMHQTDFSIAEKMNLRCDAIIANQGDREEIARHTTEFGSLQMISTSTRGVGLNRNIALLAADHEYVLFADDDMLYYDGLEETVVSAFEQMPQADVLVFGIDILKNGEIVEKRRTPIRRLHTWNAMRYGTVRIAARRQALLAKNITFHQCFGGGCIYSAGEDSLFLKACLDTGLKVYSHSAVIAASSKDSSTWFVGYNDKYFYDKGALVRHLFPKTAYIMAMYFAVRFKRQTDVSVWKRIRLVYTGVRGGKALKPYCKSR